MTAGSVTFLRVFFNTVADVCLFSQPEITSWKYANDQVNKIIGKFAEGYLNVSTLLIQNTLSFKSESVNHLMVEKTNFAFFSIINAWKNVL